MCPERCPICGGQCVLEPHGAAVNALGFYVSHECARDHVKQDEEAEEESAAPPSPAPASPGDRSTRLTGDRVSTATREERLLKAARELVDNANSHEEARGGETVTTVFPEDLEELKAALVGYHD